MQVNRVDQMKLVRIAENHFCRFRADEILQDESERFEALMYAYKQNPNEVAQAFYLLCQTGGVGALLTMEDLLRNAAVCMADDELKGSKPIREAA